jgi:protein-S-isoprenylcysteine O-methyltransferase Ste14
MRYVYDYLFMAMWIGFCAYWWLMGRQVKQEERRESYASRKFRLLMMTAGTLLLALPRIPLPPLNLRLYSQGEWSFWMGAAVTAAGIAFSIWARRYLGGNWSRAVTVKKDHELITGGPYRFVRHPIYTGLLLALLGSALAVAEVRGYLAVALIGITLWLKLRLEEKWMQQHFGEAYVAYSRRTSALVPFLL